MNSLPSTALVTPMPMYPSIASSRMIAGMLMMIHTRITCSTFGIRWRVMMRHGDAPILTAASTNSRGLICRTLMRIKRARLTQLIAPYPTTNVTKPWNQFGESRLRRIRTMITINMIPAGINTTTTNNHVQRSWSAAMIWVTRRLAAWACLARSLPRWVACSHSQSSSFVHMRRGSSSRKTRVSCVRVIWGSFSPPVQL